MNVFELPVFGPADIFPMMAEDELRELAEDIRENGQKDPIVVGEVVTSDGEVVEVLIDGRNRRSACKLAGVEPIIKKLEGGDPTAFVLSANIHRRHMTKGQRAMAVAKIYPDGANVRRKGSGNLETKSLGFSSAGLSQARMVISFAPELADTVLSGATSLDEAYKTARQRKDAANSSEAKLAGLRKRYSDLADKVVEGELTLAGALAEADARDDQTKSRREAFTKNLIDGVRGLERDVAYMDEYAKDYDREYAERFRESITPDRLRKAAAFAIALAEQMEAV